MRVSSFKKSFCILFRISSDLPSNLNTSFGVVFDALIKPHPSSKSNRSPSIVFFSPSNLQLSANSLIILNLLSSVTFMLSSGVEKSISEICSDLPILFSTPELNINVTDENKFKIIKEFADNCRLEGKKNTIDGLRLDFEDGWGLIRASNTTPKLVLRFEGKSEEILKRIQNDFLNELTRICPDIDINLS